MSRPKRTQTSSPSGLDALRALKGNVGNTPNRVRQSRPETPAPVDEPEQEGFDLFRREMRDVAPVDNGNRAELERPRPAPLPRPRSAAKNLEVAPKRTGEVSPGSDEALFHRHMADVTPLREDNRADLPTSRIQHRPDVVRLRLNPLDKPTSDDVPLLLPDDADSVSGEALFRHAIQGTLPLGDGNRAEPQRAAPPPEPIMRCEDEESALRETMEAPITLEDRLEMGDEVAFLRPGLPRRVLLDLRRGRWTLQGELDLHGLNREEARAALAHFLTASLLRGSRCVRVIHGKGLGSPGRVSILKQLSRGWLAQREEILAFCQASPTQGGSGALMVLLRGHHPTRE